MIAKNLQRLVQPTFKNCFFFSAPLQKKQKMELTLRTPYQTYLNHFDGFQRILAKTNEAALIIQNKSPPAIYVLPPGQIKIKFTQDVKGVAGEYLHTGGFVIVHLDNTCEVNLMDMVEKKEVRADNFEKGQFTDSDTVAGRYASKLRKTCAKIFTKKATA